MTHSPFSSLLCTRVRNQNNSLRRPRYPIRNMHFHYRYSGATSSVVIQVNWADKIHRLQNCQSWEYRRLFYRETSEDPSFNGSLHKSALCPRSEFVISDTIIDFFTYLLTELFDLMDYQANSAFHPSGIGKWVVIYVNTWITRVATIKRQTRPA